MWRDPGYLLDILQEARLIQEFTTGINKDVLRDDIMRQYAVVRCIEIIGEAARRVSREFRDEHPDIP